MPQSRPMAGTRRRTGAGGRDGAGAVRAAAGKGAGHIWVAIVAVTLVTLLFAWALCRAAAHADRQMAEMFLRRQEEALGGAEPDGGREAEERGVSASACKER